MKQQERDIDDKIKRIESGLTQSDDHVASLENKFEDKFE